MRLVVPIVAASLAATLASALVPALAQTAGWAADPDTGCRIWVDVPHAGGNVSWSGACLNGLAEGDGVVTTTTGNRYQGSLRAGMREGHGVLTYLNGNRFEGEWHVNKPNGPGSYNQAGRVFSGMWKNGCFETAGQRAVVASTALACGF